MLLHLPKAISSVASSRRYGLRIFLKSVVHIGLKIATCSPSGKALNLVPLLHFAFRSLGFALGLGSLATEIIYLSGQCFIKNIR